MNAKPDSLKLFRYSLLWLLLLAAIFINGAIRELTYKKNVSELSAFNISVLTGIILLGACMWFITKKWKIESGKQAWSAGILWALMTDVFEFILIHYFMKQPIEHFVNMHNPLSGYLWIVFLMWICISPYLFYWLRFTSKFVKSNK